MKELEKNNIKRPIANAFYMTSYKRASGRLHVILLITLILQYLLSLRVWNFYDLKYLCLIKMGIERMVLHLDGSDNTSVIYTCKKTLSVLFIIILLFLYLRLISKRYYNA